jgi:uncharacterized membrane protein YgcG
MLTATLVQDINHVIQLSIAPVFLLTALAGTLGVLTTRLGRVVDRARAVEEILKVPAGADAGLFEELGLLRRRALMIQFAITLGIIAALCVCVVIGAAFVGYILQVSVAILLATLFVLAMLAYIGALLFLLREVSLAITTFRVGMPAATPAGPAGGVGGEASKPAP